MSEGRGTFGKFDQDDPNFGGGGDGHDDPSEFDHHESLFTGEPEPASPLEPPRRGHHLSSPQSRRRRHPVLTALVVAVAVVLVIVGAGLVWAHGQIDPGRPGSNVSVTIPRGASTTQIGHDLAAVGIIHDSTLFALYVRLHGAGPLLSGNYSLARNSSYSAAIAALEAGPRILTDTLTIPPGYTLAQIAASVAALPGLGLSAQKFIADANTGVVRSLFEPSGSDNLEGLLFPDSYDVAKGETEADVLEKLVSEFDAQAEALGLAAAASRLGYTPYQVVEVASIVEREAKVDADRAKVASAIYNRLRIGMTLGADSTQTYFLRLTDPTLEPSVAQLDQPSPYNTRRNPGLPPTPIASPGLTSLQAAIDPAATGYLYFVEINPDGQLGFASNETGFEQLQQECRAAGLC